MRAPITNIVPNASVSIDDIYKAIKSNEHYKRITLEYREAMADPNMSAQELRKLKAKNFDYVTISGTFENRSESKLLEHSGYIAIDLDHLTNTIEVRDELLSDAIVPTTMMFTSPGGEGLKWIIKINLTKEEEHIDYFHAIERYMLETRGIEIDSACKDVSRACFLPWDPDIYYNPSAPGIFSNFIDDWGKPELDYYPASGEISLKTAKAPWDEYNEKEDVEVLLRNHGYSFVKSDGNAQMYLRPNHSGGSEYSLKVFKDTGLVHVHSSNCPNLTPGTKTAARVFCELEAGGDWKVAAAKLTSMGYVGSTDPRKHLKLVSASVLPAAVPVFWELNSKGKAIINPDAYLDFLEAGLGIFKVKFWVNDQYIPVQADGPFLSKIDYKNIPIKVKMYLKEQIGPYNSQLCDTIIAAFHEVHYKRSHERMLELSTHKTIDMLHDTKDKAYFYFKNGILAITAEGTELVPYEDNGLYILKDEVIPYDWEGFTPNYKNFAFYDFLNKISGGAADRLEIIQKALGYVMHTYKNHATAKAVIFIDEFLGEDLEKAEGGTGKTIAAKSVTHIRRAAQLAGRNFTPKDQFAFSNVSYGDKILWIDDVQSNLNVGTLYNAISTDFRVEKKNINAEYIPFRDSPKILITTNYPLTGSGDSDHRRQLVVEFAPYFSSRNTVLDEYGHTFYDDWNEDNWKDFYSCMVECMVLYLKGGTSQKFINYATKRLLMEIGPEVKEYFDENLTPGNFYPTRALLHGKESVDGIQGFRYMYPEYELHAKSLARRIEAWCGYKGYKVTRKREGNYRGFYIDEPS